MDALSLNNLSYINEYNITVNKVVVYRLASGRGLMFYYMIYLRQLISCQFWECNHQYLSAQCTCYLPDNTCTGQKDILNTFYPNDLGQTINMPTLHHQWKTTPLTLTHYNQQKQAANISQYFLDQSTPVVITQKPLQQQQE